MLLNAIPLVHTKVEELILLFPPHHEVFQEDFFELSQTDGNCASLETMCLSYTRR